MDYEITLQKQVCVFADLWGDTPDRDGATAVTVNGRKIPLDPKKGGNTIELTYSDRLEGKRTYPIDLTKLRIVTEYVHRWDGAGYIQRWLTYCMGDWEDCDSSLDIPFRYLMELKESCGKVCADHGRADELLPNDEGEYDGDYFKSVAETYAMLCRLEECPQRDTAYLITLES